MRAPRSLKPYLTCVLTSLAFTFAACGGGGGGGPAPVQVVQVTNLNNAGPGSLRHAVENAPPGAWITFDPTLAVGTVTVLTPIAIDQPRVIGGLSGTFQRFAISGGDATRIFEVSPGAALDLRDVVLQEGYSSGDSGGAIRAVGAALALTRVAILECDVDMAGGGALYIAEGTLIARDCAFTLNEAWAGGAISARETTALIERSSFAFNTASYAQSSGGALSLRSVNWQMVNCTLDSNTVSAGISAEGGAIYVTSSAFGPADLRLHACTLTGNLADMGGGILARQHAGETCAVHLHASIVAENGVGGLDDVDLVDGADATGSDNVIGVGFGALFHGVDGNQVGDAFTPLDPDLEALAPHGGGLLMRRPANGSPAVDAIPAGTIHRPDGALLTEDQRGIGRAPALPADVGAIER